MEMRFEKSSFAGRLYSMLKVDFRRMFKTPFFYIMAGICLAIPILTLVMTTMMGGGGDAAAMGTFTSVWQAIGSESGAAMAMDMTGMCNINMMYFLSAVLVCVFVAEDFRSGYAKNLFTVRSKKGDYVVSKTIVCFIACVGLLLSYFVGAMIGGAIAGLPFEPGAAGIPGIVMCMLAKVFLMAVFVGIYLILSAVGKSRTWLSLIGSFVAGMLMFMMIPMMTPIDATIMHVVLCLAGGALFSVGLGAANCAILAKSSLA